MSKPTAQEVKQLIEKYYQKSVCEQDRLRDLGDSLNLAEIANEIELAFPGYQVEDKKLQDMITVGDLLRYVDGE